MSTPTASLRSIGGLLLALGGSVAVAIGAFLILASVASALTESWGSHAGGLSLLVYGLLLAGPGAFSVRRGIRIYRATSSGS